MEEEGRWRIPSLRFRKKEGSRLKGPLRLVRLCLLSIILPGVLIAGPLYLRYRVYSGQVYPVGMSDMRLVDSKISTTWCQRQLVKSNATFNAYLLPDEPQMKANPVRMSMVRYLDLKDDMKEYWGFYLLKGSSFTVSTCCRWPGGFLTVIKGHKQLRECAYFGDDSSEEEEELEKLEREGNGEGDGDRINAKRKEDEEEAKSNEPWMMKKARPGVIFHGSHHQSTLTRHRMSKEIVSDNGNEQLNDWLPVRSQKIKIKHQTALNGIEKKEKLNETYERIVETALHFLDAVNETSRENESTHFEKTLYEKVFKKMKKLGYKDSKKLRTMLKQLHNQFENDGNLSGSNWTRSHKKREASWNIFHEELNKSDEEYDAAEEEEEEEEEMVNLMYEDLRGTFNGTSPNDRSESEFWSSFSSSEERLINCAGLIVNLPLISKKGCQAGSPEEVQSKASLANKFSYTVPSNGYYFFVFSSENEIQPNYIRVQFQFEKILYNVSNPVAACTNTTESCSLPLNFFSWEKTVLEMPLTHNDSMWNQEFVVVSVCEPRTMIYAACVVAVPVLILLFAF